MNRKWLAGFTLCILVLGFTFALQSTRAQSPVQSAQAPATLDAVDAAQAEWVAGEPFDVFTTPVDLAAGPGLPFPDPIAGDAVFFYSADAATDITFAEPPEFTMALPFPGPDAQAGAVAGGVSFVGPDPQDNITFVSFEAGIGNQVVAAAPYSAQVTSEFVQRLADGNKIERKATTTVYRDGQGRTRREQSLPAIGQYSASTTTPQAIFINDPVSGVNYVLDPARKIARKMTRPNVQFFQANPNGGPERGGVATGPGGPGAPNGPGGPGRGGPGGPGRGPNGNPPPPQGNAGGGRGPRPERPQDPNVTTESLGSQNIEGILVQGTRVVRTIPAGTVGNQNPMRVTSERWYSPDLQLNLVVKNIDPMRGTNSTTLTNIRRDEPAATLFQVPADYTVQENNPRADRMRQMLRELTPPPQPQR